MTEQERKRLKKEIGYKEHTVNIYELVDFIMIAKGQFINKYHSLPKYLKMPLWIYRALLDYDNPFIYVDKENITHCCGLIICETASIETLEQIEVF